ncbi:hypothetical protein [Williamsoniiplasma somnilux]|uniref:hypothetical protein n=1 Tax=Williamsoniiplasma somnilux TaxID=215578 RepID=UPI0012EBF72C|nr:hypothetical protein [Williamsoniiplasma somnilux]
MTSIAWNEYKFYLYKGYEPVDIRENIETDLAYVSEAKLLPFSQINENLSFNS